MKKLFLVAFAMIAMTFASCGNGKSAEAVENDSTAVDTVLVDSTALDSVVADSIAVDTTMVAE
jgi:hypothetical protein